MQLHETESFFCPESVFLPHVPVLLDAVLALAGFSAPDPVVVDATLGGAGHAFEIARRLPPGALFVGVDRDPEALVRARQRLQDLPCRIHLEQADFSAIPEVLGRLGHDRLDFLLADFGVSSFQLDEADRGFSFQAQGPLDMRMNPDKGDTLEEMLHEVTWEELAKILKEFGEEPAAGRIARAIVRAHGEQRLKTTRDLAQVVSSVVPAFTRNHHPATKTFQALRIWVNRELDEIRQLLRQVPGMLAPAGVMAVITFHSLEDRLVKQVFTGLCHPERQVPEGLPLMRDQLPKSPFRMEGPILPEPSETQENPRARSAKLRVLRVVEES